MAKLKVFKSPIADSLNPYLYFPEGTEFSAKQFNQLTCTEIMARLQVTKDSDRLLTADEKIERHALTYALFRKIERREQFHSALIWSLNRCIPSRYLRAMIQLMIKVPYEGTLVEGKAQMGTSFLQGYAYDCAKYGFDLEKEAIHERSHGTNLKEIEEFTISDGIDMADVRAGLAKLPE